MTVPRNLVLGGCVVLLAFTAACSRGPVAADGDGRKDNARKDQDKPPPAKNIDEQTIAAYQKLGANYTSAEHGDGLFAGQGLPRFHFNTVPKAKLPEVAVPFGLALYAGLTDDALKDLGHLKN